MAHTDQPAGAPAPGELGAWHRLLLTLSGRCPDDVLAEARRLLAGRRLTDLAEAVAYPSAVLGLTLTPEQVDLIAGRLPAQVRDALLDDLDVADEDEIVVPWWPFASDPGGTERPLDLTPGGLDDGPASTGPLAGLDHTLAGLDRALIAAGPAEPALTGLWRAVRRPLAGLTTALPVVLAGVRPGTPDDELPAIGARLATAVDDPAVAIEVLP